MSLVHDALQASDIEIVSVNVNDESRGRSLVHDALQASDIEIVSAVRVTGIQPAIQRQRSRRLIVQLRSLHQKDKLLRLTRKLMDSE